MVKGTWGGYGGMVSHQLSGDGVQSIFYGLTWLSRSSSRGSSCLSATATRHHPHRVSPPIQRCNRLTPLGVILTVLPFYLSLLLSQAGSRQTTILMWCRRYLTFFFQDFPQSLGEPDHQSATIDTPLQHLAMA